MPYCARLTYASTSTSSPATIRQDLIDILDEARAYNFNNKLYGVLYYGNNYFFECIEGRKTEVDRLYEKIKKDPRHTSLVLLSYHEIEETSLKNWDMKYVHYDHEIQDFFSRHQWETFNPYTLNDGLIDEFLALLIPHESVEPDGIQQDELNAQGKQQGRLKFKYVIWLIFVGMLGLIILYFLNMIPWHNGFGIDFFNTH